MSNNSLAPVAGVSLQKYAELSVKMRDVMADREACARIAQLNGVGRDAWEQAIVGWNDRISGDAVTGELTVEYYKHYREALARFAASMGVASFDAYVDMTAMLRTETDHPKKRPTDLAGMCGAFGITIEKWKQITGYWTVKLAHNPEMFARYSKRVRERVKELDEVFLRRGSNSG